MKRRTPEAVQVNAQVAELNKTLARLTSQLTRLKESASAEWFREWRVHGGMNQRTHDLGRLEKSANKLLEAVADVEFRPPADHEDPKPVPTKRRSR